MDLSINDRPVIQGRLQLHARGPWSGEFTVDALEGFTKGQSVTVASSAGLTLAATVQLAEVIDEVPHVHVIGGRGGLNGSLAAAWHTGPSLIARTVLASWATASGEQLSSTIAESVLSTSLARWVRTRGRSIDALDALADALGVNWRVLPDGTVWLGADELRDVDAFTFDLVARRPSTSTVELALDAPVSQLMPGRTFEGRKIGTVEYLLTPERCRAIVAFIAPSAHDIYLDTINALVKRAMWRERYRGLFRAEVVAVHGDWSVDLRPSVDEWPEMTEVPVLSGVAGVKAKLVRGTKVAFEFADADPMQPVVTMWTTTSTLAERIELSTKADAGDIVFQNGTLEVARRTDPSSASASMVTWMAAVETALNTLAPGSVPTLSPTFATTPGIATIASGAPKVKA